MSKLFKIIYQDLDVGCMHETSMSFHCWLSALRWRSLSELEIRATNTCAWAQNPYNVCLTETSLLGNFGWIWREIKKEKTVEIHNSGGLCTNILLQHYKSTPQTVSTCKMNKIMSSINCQAPFFQNLLLSVDVL